MRIPARILEHPLEAAIASLLLLALLFGSSELPGTKTSHARPAAASQRL
jgi:hypothetical protein